MADPGRFIDACRGRPVDATPVWLMRQAGRYMAEYRSLRERYGILEMIKTPELAAEVTLQPVRAFDVDAAIIFADILPVLEDLGFDLSFVSGTGPVIANPVRAPADIDRRKPTPGRGGLDRTCGAIGITVRELEGRIPLIGFCGAPFTLACYAIEGGGSRDFLQAKQFMYGYPDAWHRFLDRITGVLTDYVAAQADAGAAAIQVFDSWAGTLAPSDYRDRALPYTRRVVEAAQRRGVPVIHFGTGLSGSLANQQESGADVIGVDWRISLADARACLGPDTPVQGNLDPAALLAPPHEIRRQVERVLSENAGAPGHIFNLGHGVFKQTPPEHVRILVDHVHEASAVRHTG